MVDPVSLLGGVSHLGAVVAAGQAFQGTDQIVTVFNDVLATIQKVLVPSAIASGIYGAAVHTHVWHTPNAREQARDIVKYSVIGLIAGLVGPALLQGIDNTLVGQGIGGLVTLP